MDLNANVAERLDAPTEERASHELIMRILKLRWMGLDNEAEQIELALHGIDPECTLLAGPVDTD
jgi:hypothetical protein